MIDSLTPEQEKLLPVYVDKWTKIGTTTGPCNVPEVKKWISEAYKAANQKVPSFFIGPLNNPIEGAIAEYILNKYVNEEIEFEDAEDLNNRVIKEIDEILASGDLPKGKLTISNMAYGSSEYWLSYYDYIQEVLELDLSVVTPLINLAKSNCGWWTPLEDIAIFQHPPLEIHRDEQGRLHNSNGPAIKFRGNYDINDVYSVHGVRVPKNVVLRDFTANDIESETNAEVRRVMIELYGQERYLIETNAKLIHTDDFGSLYVKELDGDEDIMMVKVVNSTQEPDGTYKDYWIRVDPNAYGGLKTAKAAVASSFRDLNTGEMIFKTPDDYDPYIQT